MKMDPVQIGFLLVFIGIIFILFGAASQGKGDTDYFVGGILGFIPFGFSNDKKIFYIGLAMTVALAILYWIFSGRFT